MSPHQLAGKLRRNTDDRVQELAERNEMIWQMHRDGETLREIASHCDLSPEGVSKIVKRMQHDRILERRAEGVTVDEIAEWTGVDVDEVRRTIADEILRLHGLGKSRAAIAAATGVGAAEVRKTIKQAEEQGWRALWT